MRRTINMRDKGRLLVGEIPNSAIVLLDLGIAIQR